MKYGFLLVLPLFPACVGAMNEPRDLHCYHRPNGEQRCFATEQALSADVAREQLAAVRVFEERAARRALAVAAQRDAADAASRARAAADHADLIQDESFGVLVELQENKREAASRSAAPSPEPQTPPAP